MSIPKYAAKRDISEPEIVTALTGCGCTVYRMDKPVDLLVGFRGRAYLIDCKTKRSRGGKDKLTEAQQEFIKGWSGPAVVLLYNAQDAIDWCVQISGEGRA